MSIYKDTHTGLTPAQKQARQACITRPDSLKLSVMYALRRRLKIELVTGEGQRGQSTLAVLNKQYGQAFKRRRLALDWLVGRIAEFELGLGMKEYRA